MRDLCIWRYPSIYPTDVLIRRLQQQQQQMALVYNIDKNKSNEWTFDFYFLPGATHLQGRVWIIWEHVSCQP